MCNMVEDKVEDSDLYHLQSLSSSGVGNMNDADKDGSFVVHMGGMMHGDFVRGLG